jgi:hypothetical protein
LLVSKALADSVQQVQVLGCGGNRQFFSGDPANQKRFELACALIVSSTGWRISR